MTMFPNSAPQRLLTLAVLLSLIVLAPLAYSADRIDDRPFRDEKRRETQERERERRQEKEPPLRGALIPPKTNAPASPKR
jgi:hypothetical protein